MEVEQRSNGGCSAKGKKKNIYYLMPHFVSLPFFIIPVTFLGCVQKIIILKSGCVILHFPDAAEEMCKP
jgi:hypothetical protein